MTEKDDALEQLKRADRATYISTKQAAVGTAQVHALLEIADALREATAAFSAFNELMAKHREE